MATPKNNLSLLKWAQDWLGQAYWYGTCCYACTAALLASKSRQYPSAYTESRMSRYKADIAAGKKCADCIGLIKGYLWTREDGKLVYQLDGRPDKGANGMFTAAKIKGTIDTLPEVPGLLLYHEGHTGVYIGDGWAVEAQGFSVGIIKTQVSKRNWTHWYACPYMDYIDENGIPIEVLNVPSIPSTPVIRNLYYSDGMRMLQGEDVSDLQRRLLALCYDCGKVDGYFGTLTRAAVIAFQRDHGLETDGIVGTLTRAALDDAVPSDTAKQKTFSIKLDGIFTEEEATDIIEKIKAIGYEASLTS